MSSGTRTAATLSPSVASSLYAGATIEIPGVAGDRITAPSSRVVHRRRWRRDVVRGCVVAGGRVGIVWIDRPVGRGTLDAVQLRAAVGQPWCCGSGQVQGGHDRCGRPYEFAAAYVGHLGDYRCPACGHGVNAPNCAPPNCGSPPPKPLSFSTA